MDAIILAGGLGTRLRDTVSDVPKPLAPIQGRPFLNILLGQIEKHADQIILAIGYKAEQIKNYYQNTPYIFSEEKKPLGTGGALKQALALTRTSTVLVLNGDSYFDLQIEQLIAFHHTKNADLTIACRYMDDASRYGTICFDAAHKIQAFAEKSSPTGWINGGVYIMRRNLLDAFPPGLFSLEEDVFPKLLKNRVFAYPSPGRFIDIGTKDSYFEAQEMFVVS